MQNTPPQGLFSLRHRRAIILSLSLVALVYLLVVLVTGADAAWQVFSRLGPADWLLLLSCSFGNYLLRFVRWQYFLRRAGWRLPLRLHLAYYLAGFALTTTPGKAGETIRSVLLRPHGIPYPTSLACFFSERLLDVVVVALLAALTTLAFSADQNFIFILLGLAFIVFLLLHSPWPLHILEYLQRRLHSKRLQRGLGHLHQLVHDARNFLTLQPLALGLLLGIAAWSLQGYAFYYLLQVIGFEMQLPLAMGIYAISLLAGAVSMIPGGIGATEAAMAIMLAAAGADTHVAVVVPVINRLSTLWFAVAVGLLAAGWLAANRRLSTD
ncbi:MAG: flippase-like domain-containing protein [Gammaproteobacteria bacterium]|nr:flippase-like domain-containing protein [Gammaproteobacteria bacterium]